MKSILSGKKGVSEVIASLMLILIVVSLGTVFYSYSLSVFSSSGSSMQSDVLLRKNRALERYQVLTVWWMDGQVNVTVLNYGRNELAVVAVYLDNTPVMEFQQGLGEQVQTSATVSIQFTSPIALQVGQVYELAVASERGNVNVIAWKA